MHDLLVGAVSIFKKKKSDLDIYEFTANNTSLICAAELLTCSVDEGSSKHKNRLGLISLEIVIVKRWCENI